MNLFLNEITEFTKTKFGKIYVLSALAAATILTGSDVFAADPVTGCTSKSWNVPQPFVTLKGLIQEPINWIQIGTGILFPFILGMIFLKLKSAKGRPERIEDGMRTLYWTLGIDLAIFSLTWASGWVMSKIC